MPTQPPLQPQLRHCAPFGGRRYLTALRSQLQRHRRKCRRTRIRKSQDSSCRRCSIPRNKRAMLRHCAKRRSNLDPGIARIHNAHGANTIAWSYRQKALPLLLSGSKRKLRHKPRWRRGGGKPQRAYPWHPAGSGQDLRLQASAPAAARALPLRCPSYVQWGYNCSASAGSPKPS